MTAPMHPRSDTEPECEWDDPLTRLLLLLEIANEPSWLREMAAARAGVGQGGGTAR